jgi:hypothetical protein
VGESVARPESLIETVRQLHAHWIRPSFAIRIANAAWQRDCSIVSENVAVQRVQSRIVDIGFEHSFTEVVEHDGFGGAAEAVESLLVQLGPTGMNAFARQPGTKRLTESLPPSSASRKPMAEIASEYSEEAASPTSLLTLTNPSRSLGRGSE